MRDAQGKLIALLQACLGLGCAASLLAACQGLPGFMGGSSREGQISSDYFQNVAIQAGGRTFNLRSSDGKPLGDVKLVAGGQTYTTEKGALRLPESALRSAKQQQRGFFIVTAKGYVPKQVWIGQGTDEVVLLPLTPMLVTTLDPAGGLLKSPDAAVTLKVPPGFIKSPASTVSLSSYTPAITAEDQASADKLRKTFLTSLVGPTSQYQLAHVVTPETCQDNHPFPCAILGSLGLLIVVDGRINTPETFSISYDLGVLMRGWNGAGTPPWEANPGDWSDGERDRARAALTLVTVFQQCDAFSQSHGLAPGSGVRDLLARLPERVVLSNRVLSFDLRIDAAGSIDTYVKTIIESFNMLGVKLEVTVLSTLSERLPPALDPATLGLDSSSVITASGGTFISDQGASIISDHGGAIISNNGGSISGEVRFPFAGLGGTGKFRTLAYTDYVWPLLAQVRAVDILGAGYTPWNVTDAASRYVVTGLPDTPTAVFIEAQGAGYRVATMARAPGSGAEVADVNAASTLLSSWVRESLRLFHTDFPDVNFVNYATDVATLAAAMTQAEAEQAVAATPAAAAAQAIAVMRRADMVPTVLPRYVSAFAGNQLQGNVDGTGQGARFAVPWSIARDPAGNLYVADGQARNVRLITPGRVVTTFAGVGAGSLINGPKATAQFVGPNGIAVDSLGRAFVSDSVVIRCIDVTLSPLDPNYVTTFAGIAGAAGYVDGPLATARFAGPFGLSIDANDVLYVADAINHRIRCVDTRLAPTDPNFVTTMAGSGLFFGEPGWTNMGGFADGDAATARFASPTRPLAVPGGIVYVADYYNHRIRKIDTNLPTSDPGYVTTIAGSGPTGVSNGGFADGPALTAQLHRPEGLSLGPDGQLYFTANNRVRRLNLVGPRAGLVDSLAGSDVVGNKEGVGMGVEFGQIRDLVCAPSGDIFIPGNQSGFIWRMR